MSVSIDPFARHYRDAKAALPGAALPWLARLRDAGMDRFADTGLPTVRAEDWKYTNLNALRNIAFEPAAAIENSVSVGQVPSLLSAGTACHRLCFVNGHFRPDLSQTATLPDGVTVRSLAAVLADDASSLEPIMAGDGAEAAPLSALNMALMQDGAVIRIGAGIRLDMPVELVFLGGVGDLPVAYHPRTIVIAEAGSEATLIEYYADADAGAAPYFHNGTGAVLLHDDAVLHHRKVQTDGTDAYHVQRADVTVAGGARYDSFVLALGAALSRHELHVTLAGEGAECLLAGAYAMRGRQHCDNTTVIDHASPRTDSREVYKGVLDDQARAVFQGRITVRADAQQVNGHQLNKTLLLSDRAEIDSKPELEIFADDVKCSHGATAGELSEDQLFYLRARGIPETAARALLVQAFLTEALGEVSEDALRERLAGLLDGWLSHRDSQGDAP